MELFADGSDSKERWWLPQIREQMSGPDLHVFALKFLALKKPWIFHFFRVKKNLRFFFYKKGIMQLFSADAIVFSKKFQHFFLTPKKWKNGPQKLLIIGPDPFISQSSPDHSPQPRIDFSYYEISGPDICSLICDTVLFNNFLVHQRILDFSSSHSRPVR